MQEDDDIHHIFWVYSHTFMSDYKSRHIYRSSFIHCILKTALHIIRNHDVLDDEVEE